MKALPKIANDFFFLEAVAITGSILLIIIIYLWIKLNKSEKKRKETEDKFQRFEHKINTLELQTLESKLNPHLFKNILNSIQSHAFQTYFALDKLADVLDYILYESQNKFVTPREEIEFAMNLIEIYKIKISPLIELKIKSTINENDPLLEQKLIAPMISIDLIENAFKHVDLQNPDVFIAVTFEFKDNVFALTVANKISTRVPLKKEKSGIGNETLEKRLKIIYQDNFKLQRFSEEDVYIAQLKINLREHKAQMLALR